MKLLSDRVKIEIIPEVEISNGGLFMAKNSVTGLRNNYRKGKVIDVGRGRTSKDGTIIPMDVKVGDIVMYPIGTFKVHNDEKNEYHLIFESDIYAILEEEK